MKLIQKIFSYSEKSSKLKKSDKNKIKYLYKGPDLFNYPEDDKNPTEFIKYGSKLGGVSGAINGAIINDPGKCFKKTHRVRKIGKGSLVGTIVGTSLGAGTGYGFNKFINSDYAKEHYPKLLKSRQRSLDLRKVSEGKVSENDFIKKYYKDKG